MFGSNVFSYTQFFYPLIGNLSWDQTVVRQVRFTPQMMFVAMVMQQHYVKKQKKILWTWGLRTASGFYDAAVVQW